MSDEPERYWQFEFGENPERESYLEDQLVAYNRAHAPRWEENHDPRYTAVPVQIYVLDAEGAVVGGLIGRTHAIRDWYEITVLWVQEDLRGGGIGRALMMRGETEARARGCRYARLATSDYQAPGFYERLGYIRYGTLPNCPPGTTAFYYYKELLPQER